MQKVDILAIGVHPDDIELGCSGTLFAHKAFGKKIALLDLTQGELGTRGSAALRIKEANVAAKKLGVEFRITLDLKDGFFECNKTNLLKIIEVIRYCQPKVILANALADRHPDHGRAAKLVSDACFYSGLMKIKTTYEGVTQTKWRPSVVYHYIQDFNLKPDFVVNITPFMDKKLEVISAFKSQFFDPESTESVTPISTKEFWEFVIAKARTYGRHAGFEFGEGFNISRPIGVQNILDMY